MSVVYPTNDDPNIQPVHPGLIQEAETHPIWAVVFVGVLAVVAYAIITRLRSGGSSPASQQPSAATQPTTLYVPTANYFIDAVHNSTVTNNNDTDKPPIPIDIPPGPPQPPPNPNPGPKPPQPPPGPPPGPGNGYNGIPLIPLGQYNGPSYSPGQFHFGEAFTYQGTTYELGPGSNDALWGVALKPGEQPLTQQQWNNIPIAPGGKVLLYGPPGDYQKRGGGPPVVWMSDYVRRKPVAV